MLRLFLAVLAALFVLVRAQTVSVTDASGNVIVEVITTPAVGAAPVTSIIETIPAPDAPPATTSLTDTTSASTSTSTSQAPVTQPTIQQGPVGEPASTSGTPGAPIPYIYTTIVNGVQTVIHDTFTPTSPATVSVEVTGSGSIMAYSDFTSLFGPLPTSSATGSLLRSPSTWVLTASAIPLLVGILVL